MNRRTHLTLDDPTIIQKFGVSPASIPDYLALVGDAADGYPGIAGIGPKGAASLLLRYGRIETFPETALGERRELALLFKRLATLKTDAPLFKKVSELKWASPTPMFVEWAERLGDPLIARAAKAARG